MPEYDLVSVQHVCTVGVIFVHWYMATRKIIHLVEVVLFVLMEKAVWSQVQTLPLSR